MKNRQGIDKRYKWDFTSIFQNWDEVDKNIKVVEEKLKELKEFEGKIGDNLESLKNLFIKLEEVSKIFENLYFYTMATNHTNMKDKESTKKVQEINILANEFSVTTSFINPEIISIGKEKVEEFLGKDEFLKTYTYPLMKLFREEEHTLSKDKEQLLSYFTQVNGSFDEIYSNLTTADVIYPEVTTSTGEKILVTGENISSLLKNTEKQEDRKLIFNSLFDLYKKKENSFASIYNAIVQRGFASSKARNYNNILESFLKGDNIPNEVYENLVKATRASTEPLKRYIKLRKEKLGLENYFTFDRFLPLAKSNKKYSYEEGISLVKEAFKVMGEKYSKDTEYVMEEGVIDVFENEGKRGGAYSWGTYGTRPYIMLNYTEELNDVFTLAHELGHSMHSYYSNREQSYATHNYTIFVAEVASTFNEHLLLDLLLKNTKDKNERIYILQQAIDGLIATYYRQTLFADYELQVHQIAEKGGAITAEVLNGIMEELYKEYYGIDISIEGNKHSVWARIPHFFHSPFYVYQYATSYAASSKIYRDIKEAEENEKEEKISKFINLLKSGGNADPIEQLKKAGADLIDKATVEAVSIKLANLVDILEEELK